MSIGPGLIAAFKSPLNRLPEHTEDIILGRDVGLDALHLGDGEISSIKIATHKEKNQENIVELYPHRSGLKFLFFPQAPCPESQRQRTQARRPSASLAQCG